MEMVKEDAAKMKKFQSNIENIQGMFWTRGGRTVPKSGSGSNLVISGLKDRALDHHKGPIILG